MAIQISVNGLAKFMKASAAAQRTLLRNQKFPYTADGKKRPQIVRYSEARTAIRKYHESGNDVSVLLTAIEVLLKKEIEHPEKDASRIKDNVRAVKTYMTHFARNKFTILDTTEISARRSNRICNARPLRGRGRRKEAHQARFQHA